MAAPDFPAAAEPYRLINGAEPAPMPLCQKLAEARTMFSAMGAFGDITLHFSINPIREDKTSVGARTKRNIRAAGQARAVKITAETQKPTAALFVPLEMIGKRAAASKVFVARSRFFRS